MTRDRLLGTAFVILLLAVGGSAYLGFANKSAVTRETQRLAQTQRTLVHTQYEFAISQKASTQTRIATVTQRCELTRLILGVLVRVHDGVDAAPFQASEATCLKQLASVKAINAATPKP